MTALPAVKQSRIPRGYDPLVTGLSAGSGREGEAAGRLSMKAERQAVIVGGIGSQGIDSLNSMGIKVHRSSLGTVKENIGLFKNNELRELTPSHSCNCDDHGCK